MVAGLNAVTPRARRAKCSARATKTHKEETPIIGVSSGWHHALVAAAGTTTCATTSTAAAARSATFRRAVGPRRAGRCVRSTKGARIIAGL